MATKAEIESGLTAEMARELLDYDMGTGVFRWNVDRNWCTRRGDTAGSTDMGGYRRIRVINKTFLAHRLAWLIVTGSWPTAQIDHINGRRNDNQWRNLREATHAQNNQNKAMRRNNTSGFLGVSWSRRDGKWMAQIALNRRNFFLGHFLTPEEAHAAYLAAKARIHEFQPVPRPKDADGPITDLR